MITQRWALVVAVFVTLSAVAPDRLLPDEPRIDSLLVVQRPGKGGRSAFYTDTIEKALAHGTFLAPTEGARVTGPDGAEHTWRAVSANEEGMFQDAALQGGYGHATVSVEETGVWLLEASGHRHVYVNGEPRVGDIYGRGSVRIPVRLRRGANTFLFRGGRGAMRARLVRPPAEVFLERRDQTVPDVLTGQSVALAGIVVTNATDQWQRAIELVTPNTRAALPPLPPLSQRKLPLELQVTPGDEPQVKVPLTLHRHGNGGHQNLHRLELILRVRAPESKHVRTFVSIIDGSVQKYGVTPAVRADDSPERMGLVLSLHGAGVDGGKQAHHYKPKSWAHVVSPTNRRAFGFDWEDWGRIDALEVLFHARHALDTDPLHTWLTGHSMGGHGVWNLGAHFPDRFAALGPSAGWRDFWSYSATAEAAGQDPVDRFLARAANASRTLLLERNFLHGGVYILHGERDNNVPVAQARFMRERLATYHPNFAYYERAGAGHWWGDQCMDWPPLFDFLRQNVIPDTRLVKRLEFATVNPAVSSRCHWLQITAQIAPLLVSRMAVSFDEKRTFKVIAAENVARFEIDLTPLTRPVADGQEPLLTEQRTLILDSGVSREEIPWPEDGVLRAALRGDRWVAGRKLAPWYKNPHRGGPFKEAFQNRMVFVYATGGNEAENAWAYAKARYDAETFYYRGNGSVEVVPDVEFNPHTQLGRNVILYGNADTHQGWSTLLAGQPIQVHRDAVQVGDRRVEGDNLACLFIYPRKGSDTASVGVVSGTGLPGLALTNQLPYFVSGVAYPDWTVLSTDMYESGVQGILGAGFFRSDWSTEEGAEAVWRE